MSNFDEEFTSEEPVLTPPKEARPLSSEEQVKILLLVFNLGEGKKYAAESGNLLRFSFL